MKRNYVQPKLLKGLHLINRRKVPGESRIKVIRIFTPEHLFRGLGPLRQARAWRPSRGAAPRPWLTADCCPLPAAARLAVQWEPRVRGLQSYVLASRPPVHCAGPSHQRPAGEGAHSRGAGGVDRVRAADAGLQRHRGRALERVRAGPDTGVR